ncbi:MAG: 4'-phosphopantetheinyl transferase superfamily protein [Balneolaceae bacterium]
MSEHKPDLITVRHPNLPESIYICYKKMIPLSETKSVESAESESGRKLIEEMVVRKLEKATPKIITEKYEKPRTYIDGEEISVSFSHTNGAVSGAISRDYIVGLDMESTQRKVHPRLAKRMAHPQESPSLYEQFPAIQVWTLKEAALKAIGTGLRNPMNGVLLKQIEDSFFSVQFNDGRKAKIRSFQVSDQWISICFFKLSTRP